MRHELHLRCAPRAGAPDLAYTAHLQAHVRAAPLPPECGTLVRVAAAEYALVSGQVATTLAVVCDAEPCAPCGPTHQALARFFDAALRDLGESLAGVAIFEYFADFAREGAAAGGIAGALGGVFAARAGGRRQGPATGATASALAGAVLGALIAAGLGAAAGALRPKKRCVCTAAKRADGAWAFDAAS